MLMKMSYQGAGEICSLSVNNGFKIYPRIKGKLDLKVYDKPNASGNLIMGGTKDVDMTVIALGQVILSALFAQNSLSVKNVLGSTYTSTAAITTSAVQIAFGTGTAQGSWSDYAIEVLAGGTNPVSASVSALTTTLTSGQFSIQATWNNTTGGNVTISELATYVSMVSTSVFGIPMTLAYSHDVFTGLVVSDGGSAQATITFIMT